MITLKNLFQFDTYAHYTFEAGLRHEMFRRAKYIFESSFTFHSAKLPSYCRTKLAEKYRSRIASTPSRGGGAGGDWLQGEEHKIELRTHFSIFAGILLFEGACLVVFAAEMLQPRKGKKEALLASWKTLIATRKKMLDGGKIAFKI